MCAVLLAAYLLLVGIASRANRQNCGTEHLAYIEGLGIFSGAAAILCALFGNLVPAHKVFMDLMAGLPAVITVGCASERYGIL